MEQPSVSADFVARVRTCGRPSVAVPAFLDLALGVAAVVGVVRTCVALDVAHVKSVAADLVTDVWSHDCGEVALEALLNEAIAGTAVVVSPVSIVTLGGVRVPVDAVSANLGTV